MLEKIVDAWPVAVMFLLLMGAAMPVFWVVCVILGWC